MAAPHFTPTGKPKGSITGFSKEVRGLYNAIEDAMDTMNEYALCLYLPDGKTADQSRIVVPFDGIVKRVHMVNGAAMSGTGMLIQTWANGILAGTGQSLWLSTEAADVPKLIDDIPVDSITTMVAGQDIYSHGWVVAGGVNPVHVVVIMERT